MGRGFVVARSTQRRPRTPSRGSQARSLASRAWKRGHGVAVVVACVALLAGLAVVAPPQHAHATEVQSFSVPRSPAQLTWDGADVWVTHYYDYTVTKLRGSDGASLGTFNVGTAFPYGITFDGASVWTVNYGGPSLTRIRPSDGAVVGTVPLAVPHPFKGIFADGAIWVGGWDTNQLQAVRPDGTTRCIAAIGQIHPLNAAFDGTYIWIADGGGPGWGPATNIVRKIRASDCADGGTVAVGSNPRDIAFDGSHLWVTNNGDNTVSKVRPSDGVVIGTFPVGSAPAGIATDGQQVWVANTTAGTVSRLSAQSGAHIETITVGQSPSGILVAGGYVWVANFDSGTVSRFAVGSPPSASPTPTPSPTAPPVQPCVSTIAGDGADGDFTGGNPNPVRTRLASSAASGQTVLSVGSAIGFRPGDEIFIQQVVGGTDGAYEHACVASSGSGTITLSAPLTRSYSQDVTARTQVIRVPHLATVTGSITTVEWDGYTGGTLAFRALNISGATVDVSFKGFKGGYGQDSALHAGYGNEPGPVCTWTSGQGQAQQGHSHSGRGGCSKSANSGGGGGGGEQSHIEGFGFGSGGGGGYGSPGSGGGGASPGAGGQTYGTADLSTLHLGSGGGGATWGTNPYGGGRRSGSDRSNDFSGQGGGAALIFTRSMTSTTVRANGHAGGPSTNGYGGGGGSGGAIKVVAGDLTGSSLQALGGPGGSGTVPGGVGGRGRIRLEHCTNFTGNSVDPAPSVLQLACNNPPVANAGGPYTAAEGSTLTVTGTGSDPDGDALTFSWDLDNNGTFETAGATASFFAPDGPADHIIVLQVCDTKNACATSSAQVHINNVAPTITSVSNSGPVSEGSSATIAVSANDPAGALDPLTYEFDCNGDGSYEIGPQPMATASCFFADNGSFPVTVRVIDGDGGSATAATSVTVTNVPPTAVLTAVTPIDEGSASTVQLTSPTDPSPVDTAAGFRYAFACDGGSLQTVTYATATPNASASCPFADNGSYTVRARVIDKDDGYSEYTATLVVLNVAPTVAAGGPASLVEGDALLRNGTFSDPGADTWTATVDYGDGTGVQPLALSGKAFDLSHVYVDNGAFTVTVTVTDDDGGVGTATFVVTVANAAPVVSAGADASIPSGGIFNLAGDLADRGVLDAPWSYTIDWADDTSNASSVGIQGTGVLTGSHRYTKPATYVVTLCATDKDGATDCDELSATVRVLRVAIDVQPGSSRNVINLRSRADVRVAVLSGVYEGVDFAATSIDITTVVFAGARPTGVDRDRDVDGDGRVDRTFRFDAQALELTTTSTEACLSGVTVDGIWFEDCDAVTVVGR